MQHPPEVSCNCTHDSKAIIFAPFQIKGYISVSISCVLGSAMERGGLFMVGGSHPGMELNTDKTTDTNNYCNIKTHAKCPSYAMQYFQVLFERIVQVTYVLFFAVSVDTTFAVTNLLVQTLKGYEPIKMRNTGFLYDAELLIESSTLS